MEAASDALAVLEPEEHATSASGASCNSSLTVLRAPTPRL
jgi:hypothetical protein